MIHVATDSVTKPGAGNALESLDSISVGTDRTLKFAATHGTRKLLFTSSGAVYGKQRVTHVAEDDRGAPDPLDPSSGLCRREARCGVDVLYVAQSICNGVQDIARCFAFVGPHLPLDAHFAIGNFIRDALRGGSIEINGDGTPTRRISNAADLAIWLWTMLFRAPSVRAFNVGSERAVNIGYLARRVSFALDSRAEVRIAKEPVEVRNSTVCSTHSTSA